MTQEPEIFVSENTGNEKVCSFCKEPKLITAFAKNNQTKDGRTAVCKFCRPLQEKQKGWDLSSKTERKYKNTYKEKNRSAASAHNIIHKRLKRKTLLREPCKICNAVKVEAHHTDYTKPLDLLWLCRTHHLAWHRVFKVESR